MNSDKANELHTYNEGLMVSIAYMYNDLRFVGYKKSRKFLPKIHCRGTSSHGFADRKYTCINRPVFYDKLDSIKKSSSIKVFFHFFSSILPNQKNLNIDD